MAALAVVLGAAAVWSAAVGRGESALDLGAAGAAVAALAVLLAAVRRPPTIDVRLVADELCVRFRGWDAVWSLRREIRLPIEHVQAVRVDRPTSLWSGWWHRRLGTVLPGFIKAGWFGGRGNRELWDVRAGAEVVDLRIAPASPVSRLVLQVPDPDALARDVLAARSRHAAQRETDGGASWTRP